MAGATGVLGRSAVRAFLRAGHDVTGLARTDEKAAALRSAGASPAWANVFDPDALRAAVRGHDVVCNFATHIPAAAKIVIPSAWKDNNLLHTEGSRALVDAALAEGASRYLQHSSGFMYADGGEQWLDEDAPQDVPPHGRCILDAESEAARFAAAGGAGIAMRFGFFYGPDAGTTKDQARMARLRVSPAPGKPDAYYPSIHTEDLGEAAVAALRLGSGDFNVVDDDPLTRREIADVIAKAIGVKRLRIPPMPLKRLDYIARSQRVSNWRFKEATGWTPAFPSSRVGWPSVIAQLKSGK
jgi:nucleoside-diphosphate-sugar epimerase